MGLWGIVVCSGAVTMAVGCQCGALLQGALSYPPAAMGGLQDGMTLHGAACSRTVQCRADLHLLLLKNAGEVTLLYFFLSTSRCEP